MKATEILVSEHVVIGRVIGTMEQAVQASAVGKAVHPDFFINAADFIRGFADGCHHRKEEKVLFKAMAQSGVAVQGGPIGVMLNEHEQGRELTRAMRNGAEKWKNGQDEGRLEALKAAGRYVLLLRQHISKENNVLFPLANRLIPVENQEQVAEDFEKVEREETGEGVHEKYLALAEVLESETKNWN
jgi:hemerythrin-like domain-containing protein